jgi:hypothetical protein
MHNNTYSNHAHHHNHPPPNTNSKSLPLTIAWHGHDSDGWASGPDGWYYLSYMAKKTARMAIFLVEVIMVGASSSRVIVSHNSNEYD